MNKLKFTIFTIVLCLWLAAAGMPAREVAIEALQPDGSTVTVYLVGDEHFHYFLTSDLVPVVSDEGGAYYYAIGAGDRLVSSVMLAHNPEQRTADESAFITNQMPLAIKAIDESALHAKQAALQTGKSICKSRYTQQNPLSGRFKSLVILVDFQDKEMDGFALERFNKQFNQPGYNVNGHIGSVSDYFFDQSGGVLELSFDVVGPLKVSHNMLYYGANDEYGSDKRAHTMVKEACMLADEFVDFADYDWNGDGEVEQVFLIYAGYGESFGAPAYTIWPHKSALSYYLSEGEDPLTLDGVLINTYACSCELRGTSGKNMNSIGTPCHEFSHCLGLPDFYDVSYSGGVGMSYFDLMSSGSYNGPNIDGEVPCGYTAYEKWYLGWLDLTELTEKTRVNDMPAINDEPFAFVTYNPNNRDEYLILENRRNDGWYSYCRSSKNCHGLLVTHVDYNEEIWKLHKINTVASHQRMSPIVADKSYGTLVTNNGSRRYTVTDADVEGDLFPGSSGITELTSYSHLDVGGKWFNPDVFGSYLFDCPITNICENGRSISFDFKGGIYVEMPTELSVRPLDDNSIEVSWASVSTADSYTVEAKEVKDLAMEHIVLNENFAKFKANASDSLTNVARLLNLYTAVDGWGGRNIYPSDLGAKIGSDNLQGSITTPGIIIGRDAMTVKLTVRCKNEVQANINILAVYDNGEALDEHIEVADLSQEKYNIVYTIEDAEPDREIYLTISSDNVFYIDNLVVYDGAYTYDDILISPMDAILNPADYRIIEGIIDNTVIITGLKSSKYKIRVCTNYNNATSEWTLPAIIDLNDINSLEAVEDDSEPELHIYNLQGIEVSECIDRGIYIIDYGKYRKKVLKR